MRDDKTGAYVRIQRDGNWLNVDITALTNAELTAYFEDNPGRAVQWATMLAAWIRDNA